MIERVLVLNLDKRRDKWMTMLGSLKGAGFDIHPDGKMVYRVSAKDGSTYENGDAVKEAAVADGFDYFWGYDWTGARAIAWCWSWARVMREIIRSDKITMFILDDMPPTPGWNYVRFCDLTKDAMRDADWDHFKILQLNPGMALKQDGKMINPMIGQGISGACDFGFVLSPVGAQLLLDAQRTPIYSDQGHPYDLPTTDIRRFTTEEYPFDCLTGVYHSRSIAITTSKVQFSSDTGNTIPFY